MNVARSPAAQALHDYVAADAFPCVGGKAALGQDNVEVIVAGDLLAGGDDHQVARDLQAFAARASRDSVFLTVAVVYERTPLLTETAFETALWQRLQAIHDIDAKAHAWDSEVGSDPRAADFSLSIGGRGFYVVGLHPGASRVARRFRHAALVFNLHSQFDRLREDGRYDRLQEVIGTRDVALCGSRNPMLAAHGVRSEARQYSGRVVDEAWICPFQANAKPPT